MGRDLPHSAYTAHLVTLTNGFYLGNHEVTRAQYEVVMEGNPQGLSATPSNYSIKWTSIWSVMGACASFSVEIK